MARASSLHAGGGGGLGAFILSSKVRLQKPSALLRPEASGAFCRCEGLCFLSVLGKKAGAGERMSCAGGRWASSRGGAPADPAELTGGP